MKNILNKTKMQKFYTLTLIALALASSTIDILACTNYLVTKGASTDGSTMISYAADSHIRYGELYFKPRGTWPAG